jgi:hypothetical protein
MTKAGKPYILRYPVYGDIYGAYGDSQFSAVYAVYLAKHTYTIAEYTVYGAPRPRPQKPRPMHCARSHLNRSIGIAVDSTMARTRIKALNQAYPR